MLANDAQPMAFKPYDDSAPLDHIRIRPFHVTTIAEHRRRRLAAEHKRQRRQERNMRIQANLGNPPTGLQLIQDGSWQAVCSSCDERYEIYCGPYDFDPDSSYCGRSEWCCP